MSGNRTGDARYEPDFELPRRNVIHEHNWAEYEAQGFFAAGDPIDSADELRVMELAQNIWGVVNVYTGDAYDHESGRPLHHKPGMSVYVSPAGLDYSRAADNLARAHNSPDVS